MTGRVVFLEGVSGMFILLPNEDWGRSTLRLRLEINPVDKKAAGRGFAILKASGVSKESLEPPDSGCGFGLSAPMGKLLEKPG